MRIILQPETPAESQSMPIDKVFPNVAQLALVGRAGGKTIMHFMIAGDPLDMYADLAKAQAILLSQVMAKPPPDVPNVRAVPACAMPPNGA